MANLIRGRSVPVHRKLNKRDWKSNEGVCSPLDLEPRNSRFGIDIPQQPIKLYRTRGIFLQFLAVILRILIIPDPNELLLLVGASEYQRRHSEDVFCWNFGG